MTSIHQRGQAGADRQSHGSLNVFVLATLLLVGVIGAVVFLATIPTVSNAELAQAAWRGFA